MSQPEKQPTNRSTSNLSYAAKYFAGVLTLVPALSLGAYWIGGELALVVVALVLPLVVGLVAFFPSIAKGGRSGSGPAGLLSPKDFDVISKQMLLAARDEAKKSAVFVFEVDDHSDLVEHHGRHALDLVSEQIAGRVRAVLRDRDEITAFDTKTFGLCLHPQQQIDLEICLELAGRISRAISEPYAVDGTTIYVTVSVGFCLLGRESSDAANASEDPVSTCAKAALQSAKAAAPGAIRAFSHDTTYKKRVSPESEGEAVKALENSEIVAWFQPQISTDTGRITGFEALARWMHPSRGPLPPSEFLPQLENAQCMGRLSEVILYNALTAMRAWDQAEADIQHIGVNFSSEELSDPKLVEKISWELDRFNLTPDRLAVEILETVVARGPDDIVTRNIKGLSELGCHIDLDDFGTGHASLSSIRRFGVGRIKIDRSFVMKSDRDPEQQRMIRAILTMAEKLEIETLAEGVETVGEHSLLSQLGCTHVQGFGIGRPMPFDQTIAWIRNHNAKLTAPPSIGRATG